MAWRTSSMLVVTFSCLATAGCGPSGANEPSSAGGSSSTTSTSTDTHADTTADGSGTGAELPPPSIGVSSIGAGHQYTCARLEDASVRCWGRAESGRLGRGIEVQVDTCHSCRDDVRCCAGDDELLSALAPLSLGGSAVDLSVGRVHACAVLEGGEVRCWGNGSWGQLGLGSTASVGDDELPAEVGVIDLGAPARSIHASNGEGPSTQFFDPSHGRFTCAMLEDDTTRCWGEGRLGALGLGSADAVGDDELPTAVAPVAVGGVARHVVAGGAHACATLEGGDVRCWGFNANGELGLGIDAEDCGGFEPVSCVTPECCPGLDAPASDLPALDLGGSAAWLVAGASHSCAWLDAGGVRCWGSGRDGRLGTGSTEDVGDDELPSSSPLLELGGAVMAMAAGATHTCALLEGGTLRCWGSGGSGRLGLGNTEDVGDDELPAEVATVDVGGVVVAVTAGFDHTCAVLEDGTARCWGSNAWGQLGYPIDAECYDEDDRFRCDRAASCCIGDDELPAQWPPVPL